MSQVFCALKSLLVQGGLKSSQEIQDPNEMLWSTGWVDRKIEDSSLEDPARRGGSYLQFIPYIVLQSDRHVWCYRRKGGEGRLHGRLSCGVGGHVEREDEVYHSMMQTLANAAYRELKEETGLSVTIPEPVGLIYDDSDPVGAVHLGVLYLIDMNAVGDMPMKFDDLGGTPEGWVDIFNELTMTDVDGWETFEDRWEKWSQVAIRHLFEQAAATEVVEGWRKKWEAEASQ
jgi:predicted NUDIX family phosphoesterase